MNYKLIKLDFEKIIDSCRFEAPCCYKIKDDYILLTTGGLLYGYVVSNRINNLGLNFKYWIVEMVDECDVKDSRSYREWKIIPY